MTEWERIISAHHELWPRRGIISIIVGEWEDSKNILRFYSMTYSTAGDVMEADDQPLLERPIAIPIQETELK